MIKKNKTSYLEKELFEDESQFFQHPLILELEIGSVIDDISIIINSESMFIKRPNKDNLAMPTFEYKHIESRILNMINVLVKNNEAKHANTIFSKLYKLHESVVKKENVIVMYPEIAKTFRFNYIFFNSNLKSQFEEIKNILGYIRDERYRKE